VLKLLVPAIALAALLWAVMRSDAPMPRADFVYADRNEVTTLDIAQASWLHDFRVLRLLYEPLVVNDTFTQEFRHVPAAAEALPEVSADGLTYTFRVRSNARWSNGDAVRASDFVYSWRRSLLPDMGADYAGFFELIKGGADFAAWRKAELKRFEADTQIADRATAAAEIWATTLRKFDELVALKAIDERTLVVSLSRPVPYFLDLCAFPTFSPLNERVVRAYEAIDPRTGRVRVSADWTRPPVAVFNGPFRIASWKFKREMRLEQNPHYWDLGRLNVRTIALLSIEDANAAVLAFRAGALDWTSDVTTPYRADMLAEKRAFYAEHAGEYERLKASGLDPVEIDRRLPADARNRIHTFPSFGTYFYNINCRATLPDGRANPLADRRVRRALALAVDKRAITERIRRSGEPVASAFIPPGSIAAYGSPAGLGHDPERAKRELADAGYPGGRGLPAIEILFNKEGGHDVIAQSVARDWEETLGVSVRLSQKETKAFREDLKSGNFMVTRASWFGDFGDPATFLDIHRTGDGNNDRGYSNAAFDGLLDRANTMSDRAERLAVHREAERMLVEEEVPFIPMFHYVQLYLFDAHRISGISPHPRPAHRLDLIDVLGDGIGADRPLLLPPPIGGGR
jgi:oligopeptide transport system substrate-binding protein